MQLISGTGYSTGTSDPSAQDPEPTWVARHPLKLRSAYSEVTGSEPPYTTCHSKFLGTVDYMWYTPNVRAFVHRFLWEAVICCCLSLSTLHCFVRKQDNWAL